MPAHESDEPPPTEATLGPTLQQISAELLTLTWRFFGQADDNVRDDLQAFLAGRGYHPRTCLGWYLDSLQFAAARLDDPFRR